MRSSPSTRTLSGLNTGSSPVPPRAENGISRIRPASSGLSPAAVTSSTGSAISSSAALSGSSGLSAPGEITTISAPVTGSDRQLPLSMSAVKQQWRPFRLSSIAAVRRSAARERERAMMLSTV